MEINKDDVLSWAFSFEGEITVKADSKEFDILNKLYMSGTPEELKLDSLGYHGKVVVVNQQMQHTSEGLTGTFSVRAVNVEQ